MSLLARLIKMDDSITAGIIVIGTIIEKEGKWENILSSIIDAIRR